MDPALLRVLSVTNIVKVTNTRWPGLGHGVDLILGPKLTFLHLFFLPTQASPCSGKNENQLHDALHVYNVCIPDVSILISR